MWNFDEDAGVPDLGGWGRRRESKTAEALIYKVRRDNSALDPEHSEAKQYVASQHITRNI